MKNKFFNCIQAYVTKSLFLARLFNLWIPIGKSLPEVGRKILIAGTPIGISTGYYWGIGHKNVPSDPCKGWSMMNVTHWKELPNEPNV